MPDSRSKVMPTNHVNDPLSTSRRASIAHLRSSVWGTCCAALAYNYLWCQILKTAGCRAEGSIAHPQAVPNQYKKLDGLFLSRHSTSECSSRNAFLVLDVGLSFYLSYTRVGPAQDRPSRPFGKFFHAMIMFLSEAQSMEQHKLAYHELASAPIAQTRRSWNHENLVFIRPLNCLAVAQSPPANLNRC